LDELLDELSINIVSTSNFVVIVSMSMNFVLFANLQTKPTNKPIEKTCRQLLVVHFNLETAHDHMITLAAIMQVHLYSIFS